MARKKQPEAELQRAICEHLEARAQPDLVWWHCPNGGARSKIEAAIMVGLGVKRGVSDLHFLKGGYFFVMECKARGKDPTDDQTKYMLSVEAAGGTAVCVDDLDVALTWLEAWGLIRGKTINKGLAA